MGWVLFVVLRWKYLGEDRNNSAPDRGNEAFVSLNGPCDKFIGAVLSLLV
jgi:hypothetical protein